METESNEAYTYYQQFRITCETVVDLADSKAMYGFLFLVLLFAIFPAVWMYLLNELSIAHMVFKYNLFLANVFQIDGTKRVKKIKMKLKNPPLSKQVHPNLYKKRPTYFLLVPLLNFHKTMNHKKTPNCINCRKAKGADYIF